MGMVPLLAYSDTLATRNFYTRILGFREVFVQGMPHNDVFQLEFQNEFLNLHLTKILIQLPFT